MNVRKWLADKWYWLALAAFLIAIPGMLLEYFHSPYSFLPVAVMPFVFSALFHFFLSLPWPCAGLGAALSGLLWSLQLWGSNILNDWGTIKLIPILAVLGTAALFYFRHITLIPENCDQILRNEHGPSKLSAYLWAASVGLYLLTCWTVFFLFQQQHFLFHQQIALWGFSTCVFIVVLPLIRGCALHFVDQVEVLIDRQYQAELVNYMQVIRSQRHDFNFHLQALSGLIGQGAYEECQSYIDTMVKNAGTINDVLLIRSPALGAMLSTFMELALQKGIKLDLSIQNEMDCVPCTVYELNTIIGNLIQNAIDEVELHHQDAPWINVLLMKRGGNNVVRVTNPFSGDPKNLSRVLEVGFSTKKAHEGIGLTTVQRILARYGGLVFPEFRDGTVSFIAQFPIDYRNHS